MRITLVEPDLKDAVKARHVLGAKNVVYRALI